MTKSSGRSKWVVVGGAGFIGSNLCRALMERGDRVVCIDNFSSGRWENITDLIEKGMVCFKEDAQGESDLSAIDGAKGVFYLASFASPKFYLTYPISTIATNTVGLQNWLEKAKRVGSPVIYTSTSEIYGDPEVPVQNERYNGNVCTQGVRAVYDESKRLGETLCATYSRLGWTDTKTVRIFNTYGPGMRPDDGRVLPNFINQALDGKPITVYGDGSQTRSFCYIRDMVEALIRVGDKNNVLPTMNLGNDIDYLSVMEVAEMVREEINPSLEIVVDESKLVDGDPKVRRPDCTLAQREIQWKATIGFKQGLKETIEYFRGMRNVGSNTE